MADLVPGVLAPAGAETGAGWLLVHGDRILERPPDGEIVLPDPGADHGPSHYLGTLGGRHVFACEVPSPAHGLVPAGLRSLLLRLPAELGTLAGRAMQVVDWDRTHRYCGRCGAATDLSRDERARRCPSCGLVAHPRVAPAAITLVRRGPELLLARGRRFATPIYSLLAGFVEPGETLEQAAAREVREEVGIEIAEVRYWASQPWPFPHSLMVGFVAEYAGGRIAVDGEEIVDARWFAPDRLPDLPPPISIARRMIDWAVA